VAMRFNPPPGWPAPPEGFTPDPGWRPDPSWPPVPPGWQLWVPEETQGDASTGLTPGYLGYAQAPAPAGSQWAGWAPPVLAASSTSGMAIAGFVLGLLGFGVITAILGIVFGAVALSRIRTTGQGGKGLAIAGIVLGSCWLALFVILIVIGAVVGATSGPSTTG
jgi:Domain of unknown function (DUF4190)